jgi:hypothetical protein
MEMIEEFFEKEKPLWLIIVDSQTGHLIKTLRTNNFPLQSKDIVKGTKFICIKSVLMGNNPNDIGYVEGKIYTSDVDGNITDEDGDQYHSWTPWGDEEDDSQLNEHFQKFED